MRHCICPSITAEPFLAYPFSNLLPSHASSSTRKQPNNCALLNLHVHYRRAIFGSLLFESLAESYIFLHLQTGTFCGVFRRQALDRGACLMGADKIATGHNADDIAESVLLNFLRGDISRLGRCVSIITGEDGPLPRSKPFKYTYEKEIVLYAYFKKLVYFSTECIYAPNSYRGHAREYLKNLEASNPQTIISASTLVRVTFIARNVCAVSALILANFFPCASCQTSTRLQISFVPPSTFRSSLGFKLKW